MAKSSQDEMSEANKPSSPGRESQFTGRDTPSAFGRGMPSAARNPQPTGAPLASMTMFQPYAELLLEMEVMHQQWANGMRATAERTLDFASRFNAAAIAEAKRTADLLFRTYEGEISAQSLLAREMQYRTSSALRSEAAE